MSINLVPTDSVQGDFGQNRLRSTGQVFPSPTGLHGDIYIYRFEIYSIDPVKLSAICLKS